MPPSTPSDLMVTCALIRRGNQVLCTRRSASMPLPLKWEFPGGKLEPGEDPEECILREIKEELSLHITLLGRAPEVRHPYRKDRSLILIPFVAEVKSGKLHLLEHAEARWCLPTEMPSLDWVEADIMVLKWWLETGQYTG